MEKLKELEWFQLFLAKEPLMRRYDEVVAIAATFVPPPVFDCAVGYGESPMARLDLSRVVAKLCHPTRGKGWDRTRADAAVDHYKKWLWLRASHPGLRTTPTEDIDEVWHIHILDTRRYADDCQDMFGCFLHHEPFTGMEGDEVQHLVDMQATQAAFQKEHGQSMVGATAVCGCSYDISAFIKNS